MVAGSTEDLSELVHETMVEEARSNQWHRLFPCLEDPMRYLDKFEVQRTDTKYVCQALKDWHSRSSGVVLCKGNSAVQPANQAWR